jgi:hypothetical protein
MTHPQRCSRLTKAPVQINKATKETDQIIIKEQLLCTAVTSINVGNFSISFRRTVWYIITSFCIQMPTDLIPFTDNSKIKMFNYSYAPKTNAHSGRLHHLWVCYSGC